MRRYKQIIQDACTSIETLYASCGEFMVKAESELISINDNHLYSMKSLEGVVQLDNRSIVDELYQLYKTCFNDLNRGRILKFSALNAVNVNIYQHYLPELEDLTLIEEYVIVRSH